MSDQIEFSLVDEDRSFVSMLFCPVCGYQAVSVKHWDFKTLRNKFFIRCTKTQCNNMTPEFADLKTAAQVWKVAEALTR